MSALHLFGRLFTQRMTRRHPSRTTRHSCKPEVEYLEARTTPSVSLYVNPLWAAKAALSDPDGAGPATKMGVDAFATIPAAITAANPGDTVILQNGLYHESNISVNKAITIQGQSRAGVIIGPNMVDGHDDSTWGGTTLSNGFLLRSGDVTIRNLTIDGNKDLDATTDHNFRAGIITDSTTGLLYNDITVENVTVQHTYRRGIQLFSPVVAGVQSTGQLIQNNTVNDVTKGPGIAVFDVDGVIRGNTVKNTPSGIEAVQWSASGGMLVTVAGNTISHVNSGIQLVVPREGSLVGGPSMADRNVITLTGGRTDDVGVIVRNAIGSVSVENNLVTGSKGDAGIWLFGDGDALNPVVVKNNLLRSSASMGASAGQATGVFVSDDGRIFTDGNSNPVADLPGYANLVGNRILGFATGVEMSRSGLTGGNLEGTISGNTIAGAVAGIQTEDADGTAGANVAVAMTGNVFRSSGYADNRTDVHITDETGPVTFGDGNRFFGNNYYIENHSSQSFDLSGLTATTYDKTSNFRIEDRMLHAPDMASSGLITWVAGHVFVTAPGTGASDESIQRAIVAASDGDVIQIEAGVYTGSVDFSAKELDLVFGASPGRVTIVGDFTVGANNTLIFELAGAAAGTRYDQLKVNGTANLGGAVLEVEPLYDSRLGTRFALIDSEVMKGEFALMPDSMDQVFMGQRFLLDYQAIDGGDFTLTRLPDK